MKDIRNQKINEDGRYQCDLIYCIIRNSVFVELTERCERINRVQRKRITEYQTTERKRGTNKRMKEMQVFVSNGTE